MQFNHLHFEWREPNENQPVGYFDYFIDFRPMSAWTADLDPNPGFYDECNGVIRGDGNPYDEAFILRLLGKDVDSPEIQAVVQQAGYDYSHGLYWQSSESDEIWTPIYVQSCCGDIGCGGWVIKIVALEDRVEWRFGGEDQMQPFVFRLDEYQKTFDDLRRQIEKRIAEKSKSKTA